jgi:predicted O-linked N-acetylglucosamine transferase (SPINDLY family)
MTPELRQHLITTDTHRRSGNWSSALDGYVSALKWLPDEPIIEHNLGLCYLALGNSQMAETHSQRAIKLKPAQWQSALILAKALTANGKKNQALELLEQLAKQYPTSPEIVIELAKLLMQHGGDASRACLLVMPFLNTVHHKEAEAVLLVSQLYDRNENVGADNLSEAFCKFADTYLQLPAAGIAVESKLSEKQVEREGKRLKVGLLSPQFSVSPVYFFTFGSLRLLANHVDFVFFNRGTKQDWATKLFQGLAHQWIDVNLLSAQELSNVLLSHNLDVLIDLGGWMDPVALQALSIKPAKKMFKWVGGQSVTTGLRAFDGFFTDAHQTPVGSDHLYSEPLIRLQSGYVTYTPPPYLPKRSVKQDVYFDIGVIANPAKVSRKFLIDVKKKLPKWQLSPFVKNKKLRLKFIDQRYEQSNIRERIQKALPDALIDFVIPNDHLSYLKAVGQLDITLDTWPYSGGLTTIEALAMGVPNLTQSGQLFCERHTEAHCFYAGLDLRMCDVENFTNNRYLAKSQSVLLKQNSPRLDHESLANELLFYLHVL